MVVAVVVMVVVTDSIEVEGLIKTAEATAGNGVIINPVVSPI